jgi:hypothetical protein
MGPFDSYPFDNNILHHSHEERVDASEAKVEDVTVRLITCWSRLEVVPSLDRDVLDAW